ncbi:GNAT family N-acetyltransferase [Planococcus sp. PAMC 21323]|uniref:GNAT family N-acetyltransferase n=1 Tax=Planococcus sp. PAMC 21323 TaxID=1526927 RepID=UPI00056FD986|nr:GNAT family N-acetyltransferase [Planococcus sp. PAMC 21323]
MTHYLFVSKRLGFRRWQQMDREKFAVMSSDKEVMRYFPETMTENQSAQLIDRFEKHMDDNGYSMWAVERKEDEAFIGFIGFLEITIDIEGKGSAEIGWRLDKRFWKKGYATEGAKACLAYAFDTLNMKHVYSFTASINKPSEAVMKRIGMNKVGEFDHAKLKKNSPLERHVLYKIDRPMIGEKV